jgi:hypothetical protein
MDEIKLVLTAIHNTKTLQHLLLHLTAFPIPAAYLSRKDEPMPPRDFTKTKPSSRDRTEQQVQFQPQQAVAG